MHLCTTALNQVKGHFLRPSVQLSLQLFTTHILVLLELGLHLLLALNHEFPKDFSHASIHPMDCLTTALFLLIELNLASLAFLIYPALEHSGTHLGHLLLLLVADRSI